MKILAMMAALIKEILQKNYERWNVNWSVIIEHGGNGTRSCEGYRSGHVNGGCMFTAAASLFGTAADMSKPIVTRKSPPPSLVWSDVPTLFCQRNIVMPFLWLSKAR